MMTRNDIIVKVLKGELPADELTDEELLDIQMRVMDFVMYSKMDEGKIVFTEVEHGLLN